MHQGMSCLFSYIHLPFKLACVKKLFKGFLSSRNMSQKRLHSCCFSLCHSHETKQLGGNEHCFSLAFSLIKVSIFLHRIAQMRGIEYRLPRLFIYFCSSRTLVTINTQLFGMVNIWSDGACCGGSDQDLCHPHHHHHHHHCHPHPHHHYLQDLVCGGRGHRGVKHDAVAEDWGETDTKLSDTSHIYATNRMHRKHHIHQR